jgi:hypothetical protein
VTLTEIGAAASEMAPKTAGVPTGELAHTGKYRPLWEWLLQQERREIAISFAELERQADITMPDSCRAHVAHWHSYQGSTVARAMIDAGWHASRVELNAGTLSLVPGPPPGRR